MFLDRPTHRLWVTDHRGEARRTLVLVTGGGDDETTWAELIPELQPFGRVVTYDHVGHGRSSIPDVYRRRMLEDDCDAVLQWTDHPAPILIGHSLGAGVAVWMAHHGSPRPAGVVLIDGAPSQRHFQRRPPDPPDVARARLSEMGFVEPQLSFFVAMSLTDPEVIYERLDPDLWFGIPVPTIADAGTRGMSADVRDEVERRMADRPNPLLELRWSDAGQRSARRSSRRRHCRGAGPSLPAATRKARP